MLAKLNRFLPLIGSVVLIVAALVPAVAGKLGILSGLLGSALTAQEVAGVVAAYGVLRKLYFLFVEASK